MLTAPLLALALLATPPPETLDLGRHRPWKLRSGLVLPYPLDNLFRGSFSCGRGRRHLALDIGGVGPDGGLGTPVRAMADAKIVAIFRPEDDPARWGERDIQEGETLRGRHLRPRSREIPGYGRVYFFTKERGSARTGVLLVTRLTSGPRRGYLVRYLHLAAVRPDLAPGSQVSAGEEIGLMGGTAVQDDAPHLHLDITNRAGKQVDVGPLLGVGSTRLSCKKAVARAARQRYIARARKLMAKLARAALLAQP